MNSATQVAYEKFLISLYAFWIFLFFIIAHYAPPLALPAYLMLSAAYLVAKEVESNREDREHDRRWGLTNLPVVYDVQRDELIRLSESVKGNRILPVFYSETK